MTSLIAVLAHLLASVTSKGDGPLPPSSCSFVDTEGNPNLVSGDLSFFKALDGSLDVAQWEVYFGYFAEPARLVNGPFSDNPSPYSIINNRPALLLQSFSLDAVVPAGRVYFFIFARNNETRASETPCAGMLTDNSDLYWLITYFSSAVGSSDEDSLYGPRVLAVSDGKITMRWEAPRLDNVDPDTHTSTSPTGASQPVIDLSKDLFYDLSVGRRKADGTNGNQCQMSLFPWPIGAPSRNFVTSNTTYETVFELSFSRAQLVQCGFRAVASNSVDVYGMFSFYVRSVARSDGLEDTVPQIEFRSQVTVRYLSLTSGTSALINLDGVLALDDVTATLTYSSFARLFNDSAFSIMLSNTTAPFFTPGDRVYAEQLLALDLALFDIYLERLWFSYWPEYDAPIELELSPTDSAFTNLDQPSVIGRHRMVTTIPFVTNCDPCYLHFESRLTPTATNKADGGQEAQFQTSRVLISVGTGFQLQERPTPDRQRPEGPMLVVAGVFAGVVSVAAVVWTWQASCRRIHRTRIILPALSTV